MCYILAQMFAINLNLFRVIQRVTLQYSRVCLGYFSVTVPIARELCVFQCISLIAKQAISVSQTLFL